MEEQIKFKTNYGFTILKSIENNKMHGNIVLPDMGKDNADVGEIIDYTPTYNYHTGDKVLYVFSIGDHVVFPPMAAKKFKKNGIEYMAVPNNDIITKIN